MTESGSTSAPDAAALRSRLLGVKLRALVADHLGPEVMDRATVSEARTIPDGAGLLVDDAAWVLVDGDAHNRLGGSLAWAIRQGATSLQLVAERHTGALARRAEQLRFPVTVWFAEDRTLLPAVAEPLPVPPAPDPEHLALAPLISAAGADVTVEHGIVAGEVRGLEVCRVVDQPTSGMFAEFGDIVHDGAAPVDDTGILLEVGVGANDREAFRLLHGDLPTPDALAVVIQSVIAQRHDEAPQHPLNRLAAERYLRWRIEQHPELVGMATVTAAAPPLPRPNLKDPTPCVATATDHDGTAAIVVCSTGVDLDLVGFVADVQATAAAPVVVALPRRDVLPITAELLASLATPVTVVPID